MLNDERSSSPPSLPLPADPIHETHRVVLRPLRQADLQSITDILGQEAVSRWWGEHDLRKVEAEFLGEEAVSLAIEVGGTLAGAVQFTEELDPDYRHASIDIFLSTQWQGAGYGPEALKLLASHLIHSRGHHRITIDPAVENDCAIRAYKKVGFRPVGVMRKYERGSDGRWRDALLMDLLAEDLDLEP